LSAWYGNTLVVKHISLMARYLEEVAAKHE
jgi:hypothetical protein